MLKLQRSNVFTDQPEAVWDHSCDYNEELRLSEENSTETPQLTAYSESFPHFFVPVVSVKACWKWFGEKNNHAQFHLIPNFFFLSLNYVPYIPPCDF